MDEEAQIDGVAGDPVELPYGRGGATGASWTWEMPRGIRRVRDADPADPPTGAGTGGSAEGRIRVVGERPGEYLLVGRFGRSRSAEPDRLVRVRLRLR